MHAADTSTEETPSADSRRLKVLLLIPTLDRSGAEKQLMLLATRLPREEFDVHVVCLTRGGPYAEPIQQAGIPVTMLGKRLKGDPRALWRLKALIQEQRPDIVHSWLFAANAYARLAVSGKQRPKVVVSERCVDSWKSRWQLWLDRRLISRTDAMVANSRSVADFYEQQGVPRALMHVIPNGIAVSSAAPLDRQSLLQELQLPADAKLVACVGRLAKQKCVGDLLWGFQVLRQADPRAYLLVIGDGPERDNLIERAGQLECSDHVRFLGHREDADRILPLIDVYWLASAFEGMSNSLMEAMSLGLPVIATDIPPNRELITHGRHGYLVNPRDGVGFAQYTVKLFEDPALANQLSSAAKARMTEEFNIERMVESYVELYRRLTAAPA